MYFKEEVEVVIEYCWLKLVIIEVIFILFLFFIVIFYYLLELWVGFVVDKFIKLKSVEFFFEV